MLWGVLILRRVVRCKFEPQKVTIKNRTESFVVVEGVGEGTEVALVNPEEQGKRQNKGPAGPAGVAGGGR